MPDTWNFCVMRIAPRDTCVVNDFEFDVIK